MREYHKIQTVFNRDPETSYKKVIFGEFSTPEFEYLQSLNWVYTEKVDGTNIRIMFDGANITCGGKTDRAELPPKLLEKLISKYAPQEQTFKETFKDAQVCLYGEGYGARIQKGGGNYRRDQGFVLFDVWVGGWWLKREDVEAIGKLLDTDVVPIMGVGDLWSMAERVKAGFNSRWGDFRAEGLVARPEVELLDRGGRRIITKLKCKDF